MISKCSEKGHRYQKFDDTSLFCERCGERKFIATSQPWWGVWPYVPPTIYPWYPSYKVTVSTGDSSGSYDTITTFAYPNSTSFSLTDGSGSDA